MSTEPEAGTAKDPFVIIDEITAERDSLKSRVEDLRASRDENYAAGKKWKSNAEALEKQRDELVEDLHRITVEKARLEGYIDRVREFDPQPEPVMVPQRPDRHVNRLDGYGYSGMERGPAPWYLRNLERNA